MQVFKITSENIAKAVDFLRQGGVVIHPTDTCYGIAADILNQKAVKKVAELKKMSLDKPMSILVSDFKMLEDYGVLSDKAREIAQKYLPGPLTLLLPKTNKIPAFYAQGGGFVGIRLPAHELSCELARSLGNPITTTSANLTGKPQAYSLVEVEKFFQKEDVLVLDDGNLPYKPPSTIVKIVENQVALIREGELEVKV